MFELKCSAAGGRLEPDPTAARRAAGERVTIASRVGVTRSDSATLAAMTRWHGPGPVTTRMTQIQDHSAAGARAAGRRVKARPLRPGQQGWVSLNLECRLFRPCGSPGRRLGRRRCPGTPGRCRQTLAGPPGGRRGPAAGSPGPTPGQTHGALQVRESRLHRESL